MDPTASFGDPVGATVVVETTANLSTVHDPHTSPETWQEGVYVRQHSDLTIDRDANTTDPDWFLVSIENMRYDEDTRIKYQLAHLTNLARYVMRPIDTGGRSVPWDIGQSGTWEVCLPSGESGPFPLTGDPDSTAATIFPWSAPRDQLQGPGIFNVPLKIVSLWPSNREPGNLPISAVCSESAQDATTTSYSLHRLPYSCFTLPVEGPRSTSTGYVPTGIKELWVHHPQGLEKLNELGLLVQNTFHGAVIETFCDQQGRLLG